jgi:flagellar biosynthesis GTPase FlhF
LENKRFVGNDLSRLYRRVHAELGADALVLGTRSLHREGAAPLIELTATAGDGELPLHVQQAALHTVLSRVAPGLTVGDLEDLVLRGVLGNEFDDMDPLTATVGRALETETWYADDQVASPEPEPEPEPTLAEVLEASGLSGKAARLVEAGTAAGAKPERALTEHLARLLARYPDERQTAIVTIDGAHGAGRTTALLRMALDCSEAGRAAVLVAADGHAGTVDRIARYADAMGLPWFEAFDDRAMLRALRKQARGTCLFVDAAPGWTAPATAVAPQFSYLALPANWQAPLLHERPGGMREGRFSGVIPTFADTVTDLTRVVSTAIESSLGIAFLSSGSDISTGIEVASFSAMASGILRMRTGERTNGSLVTSA